MRGNNSGCLNGIRVTLRNGLAAPNKSDLSSKRDADIMLQSISVWQMPDAIISTRTSSSPGPSISITSICREPFFSCAAQQPESCVRTYLNASPLLPVNREDVFPYKRYKLFCPFYTYILFSPAQDEWRVIEAAGF